MGSVPGERWPTVDAGSFRYPRGRGGEVMEQRRFRLMRARRSSPALGHRQRSDTQATTDDPGDRDDQGLVPGSVNVALALRYL
jgi:hypothetical protein